MPLLACRPVPGRRVVLPWRDGVGLFRARPPEIDLLAHLPVEGAWRARTCEAGCHLLVIDRDGLRLRGFAIGDDGGLEPLDLPGVPAAARFDDVLMVGPVFAGGALHGQPALWTSGSGLGSPGWRALPLPELGRTHEKSIDHLLRHDDELIAVDDLVFPHWVLTWDIADPCAPRHRLTAALPAHTTYEHVHRAACGSRYLALLSSGVNHAAHGTFLAILDAGSLRELACYAFEIGGRAGPASGAPPWRVALAQVSALAFAGDILFAAAGSWGLLRLDLRGPPLAVVRGGSSRGASTAGEGPPLEVCQVPGLDLVAHLAAVGSEGVYATGFSPEGEECIAWVSLERP